MKRSKQKTPPAKRKLPAPVIWAFIVLAVIALAIVSLRKREPAQKEGVSALATTEPIASTNLSPTASAATDFQKLKGKWLRPDGGYVIDIKAIDATGKLDASYLNPRPIHVAKAEASQEGGALKVFIELQDVNYPGSTYTLVYKPERDLLAGVYYQALQRQSFEVYFERIK